MYTIIVILLLFSNPAIADKRMGQDKTYPNIWQCFSCYLPKISDWSLEQQYRKGLREDPYDRRKTTTCRLKKRVKTKSGQQVCVYRGANNTYTVQVESQCPKQFLCKYNPGQEEPNIDAVIDSLNKSMK